MARSFDVVVVGLGAMGSAAAMHLARRGHRVLGLDRHVPPHTRGSSHGQTRIIREAYLEHPSYVPLVQRAYELWAELEQDCGRQLLRQTGGLMIGPPGGAVVAGARLSAELHRLPHRMLSAAEVRSEFAVLQPGDEMVAVWEPRAGVLFPEACVEAHLSRARAAGATLQFGEPVFGWRSDGDGKGDSAAVSIRTARGEYRAAQLLLSAGAWMPTLLAEGVVPLTVERQVQAWFSPLGDAAMFAPERCPVHIWEGGPDRYFYGFPDFGHGVKLARHHQGAPADPETMSHDVADDEVEAIRSAFRSSVPRADGALRSSAACLYTNTPDRHFWIDRHPGYPQVLIASPCSGHGFKFSSAIGECLADILSGQSPPFDLSLFARR